ncbi:MAG: HTH-type transcriptional repressor NicS [Bacteroidetes bacterium ADurb.Bin141]|nr:MAG: HTH-type transcriptional repressor NicS [Bacteroidetes bacterium ADurb.Bin141]
MNNSYIINSVHNLYYVYIQENIFMGISERREMEKKALKKKIFDSASEIIINEGYEKLSIRKIAQKIEYSPAVIYNYFKNKDSLVTSIVQDTIIRIYSSMMALDLEKLPVEEALRKGLTEFLWLLIENPQQYRATSLLWLTTGNPHQNKPYDYYENTATDKKNYEDPSDDEIIKILAGILERGINEGVFRKLDAKLNAMLMVSSVFGLISRVILDNVSDKETKAKLFDSLVDLLVNSVLQH